MQQFVKKSIEVNYLSGCYHFINIRFKTPMLRSNLSNYRDAYIFVKGRIRATGTNNALFRSCISKINNMFIDNAEDLDTVIPTCNLLKYSGNYS